MAIDEETGLEVTLNGQQNEHCSVHPQRAPAAILVEKNFKLRHYRPMTIDRVVPYAAG